MEVVNLLAPPTPRVIDIVPLLGESSRTYSFTQMNQMILQTAQSFSGKPHFLLSPMLVGSRALRDALFEDDVVREVVERWDRLTVACVGIGVVPPLPGMVVYIGDEYTPVLNEKGAVGDICGRYFSRDGELIETELYERMIGVSLSQLKSADCVIAVAGGVEKAPALVGALRMELITSLVIDEALAESVLAALD
jgi:DNA-binding transcriptional regulator LsrR (DeoR family)